MEEPEWLADTRTSYDTVAASYADQLRNSLDDEYVVRHMLALFGEMVHGAGGGPVADVGCGTGRITAHLLGLGLDAFGVDLSPGMIAMARRDYPGIRFDVGSMTDLHLTDESTAGVLWFSIVHVPDPEVRVAFRHFRRVLRPAGVLLLGFFVGDSTTLKTEGYGGHPMRVYVHRRPADLVVEWLHEAGFRLELRVLHHRDDKVSTGMLMARPRDVSG